VRRPAYREKRRDVENGSRVVMSALIPRLVLDVNSTRVDNI
jgi:hypothetical protein